MRQVNLFLAAAMIVFGSVTALWAAHVPASNSPEISTRDQGPAPVAVPVGSAPAPAVVAPPSPVVEIAADPGIKGQPEVAKSDPVRPAEHMVVPQPRPVAHRVRLGCFSSHHHVARVANPPGATRIAAPWATGWPAVSSAPQCGSNRCLKFVLLGVGY